eukprot:CAMPEP_0119004762 /NCGR_PEP_ID=MMETSP1176-20130426/1337_1 /TAXON_ID=265551 /ORGANISM="Synedropsis recta cf, Strain CCMP1620" /LENGTH=279 /DNA_ID=CAMNT_0006956507 /DNA_START=21 /DNA_END=860 /DNA_ORIENTATION=+
MAPTQEEHPHVAPDEAQSLFVIRHGDRWDYQNPEWLETAKRRGDPPLSTLGHQQARETGIFLDQLLAKEGFTGDRITWLASPFLRTLQTSDDALNAFTEIDTKQISILPEYSVFEMDGHDGMLHKDLPGMDERKCYFPRLDDTHESLFVPELPEPRDQFLTRCDNAMTSFNRRYSYSPGTAFVIVTHAAACIGLSRAASNATLQEVHAAGPCSVFRLTRTSPTDVWDLDHFSKEKGLNGYSDHISVKGNFTYPWNNFASKAINRGYTGPPGHAPNRDEL